MSGSVMRATDTNLIIRLITRDDARQTAAAENFVATGAWVPVLALTEAVRVLDSVYGLSPKEQGTAIEMLRTKPPRAPHRHPAFRFVPLPLEHRTGRDSHQTPYLRRNGSLPLGCNFGLRQQHSLTLPR